MKLLKQPIPEAFTILKRDNPGLTFRLHPDGVWLQLKSGDWTPIISTGCDYPGGPGIVRVFEPGENVLSFSNETFQQVFAPKCTA